jgi:hypothetical protein
MSYIDLNKNGFSKLNVQTSKQLILNFKEN